MKQEDLKIKVHTVELRVYAKTYEFSTKLVGHLDVYQLPVGKGIHVDSNGLTRY
jgi:propionyl-CoA carboxylase alpha chain